MENENASSKNENNVTEFQMREITTSPDDGVVTEKNPAAIENDFAAMENNPEVVEQNYSAMENNPVTMEQDRAAVSAGAVYLHSSFDNPYGSNNIVNPPSPDPSVQNQNFSGQPVPASVPPREYKKKEVTYRRGRLALAFACVILATSILTSAVSFSIWNYYGPASNGNSSLYSSESSSASVSSQTSSASANVSTAKGVLTIAEINKKVNPSVVFIGIETTASNGFGQQETASGSGSGIILTKDGYILTNFHVIDSAKKIIVKTIDQKSYPARIIGSDPKTDLAVLKIDATNLAAATFGDSTKVEVGDLAVVIGNPLGTLDGTLTVGVISALNRSVTIDTVSMNLMQTDAAVNPGNSGGALVNAYGEVIGIVNAKTSAVGIEGLGYAIPVSDAKPIIDDLMTSGFVTGRIKIGITTKDITADLSSYYNLPVGIYVTAVEKGSAAEKAGIVAKDIIIGVDGADVLTTAELGKIKESHKVGDSIKILISRNGKKMSVTLVFEQDVPVLG